METKLFAALTVVSLVLVIGCSDTRSLGGGCAVDGDWGCICRADPWEGETPFDGTCAVSGFGGERAICCQGDDYCRCELVRCGISAVTGLCLCGVGAILDSVVGSCDGTASTCCTQDTGYCYCEEGCQNRFANRPVGTCNAGTDTATCGTFETRVTSCE
jgi:hypothetical protein